MAFGQPSGPPASSKQVQELLGLLQEAGHLDFRDARGPLGFTQRQAGGRFTRDEAEMFIERLQNPGSDGEAIAVAPAPGIGPDRGRPLRHLPSGRLVAELEWRGYTVTGPPDGPGAR
jgi:hypothetical protein